jgi:protein-tyrosine phosphatase
MTQAGSLPLAIAIPRAWPWRAPGRWAVRALIAFVAFLVAGNLVIQGVSLFARSTMAGGRVQGVDGVDKLRAVDDVVWRGANPSEAGYQSLAGAGVTVVVDLRAEDDAAEDDASIEALGMRVVHVPIRDGQTPSSADVDRFLAIVRDSGGTVFVHCGAGVGRTGAMAAAYLMATDQAGPGTVLGRNLAVGPPSLEQIVYAANGGAEPGGVVKALSRTLDAPRRILATL